MGGPLCTARSPRPGMFRAVLALQALLERVLARLVAMRGILAFSAELLEACDGVSSTPVINWEARVQVWFLQVTVVVFAMGPQSFTVTQYGQISTRSLTPTRLIITTNRSLGNPLKILRSMNRNTSVPGKILSHGGSIHFRTGMPAPIWFVVYARASSKQNAWPALQRTVFAGGCVLPHGPLHSILLGSPLGGVCGANTC